MIFLCVAKLARAIARLIQSLSYSSNSFSSESSEAPSESSDSFLNSITSMNEVPGTDSNSELMYIYYDSDMATEEDVITHEYAPDAN